MMKPFFAALLFLLCAQPGWAAYSFIAGRCDGSADTSNVTTTAIDTSGADFIVMSVNYYVAAQTPDTISDSKGNTWNGLTERRNTNVATRLYWSRPTSVGSGHTFSALDALSPYPSICVAAFSGSVASPADQENGNNTDSSVASLATGSITPTESDELIISSVVIGPNGLTMTVDSGMTEVGDLTGVSGQYVSNAFAYKIQTTAAAINATWTPSSNADIAVAIASFKAGVGGATPTRRKAVVF